MYSFRAVFFKPNKTKSHMKKWRNWTLMIKTDKRLSKYIQPYHRIRCEVELELGKKTGYKETAEPRGFKRWRKQCVALRKDNRSQTNKRGSPTNTVVRRQEKEKKKPQHTPAAFPLSLPYARSGQAPAEWWSNTMLYSPEGPGLNLILGLLTHT